MCNHKVPALLPFKTVKGLSDYVGFKEDGTMVVGAGMEVDGSMTLNSPTDLKFKQGSLPKQYYWHFVRMKSSASELHPYSFLFSFLMPATSNLNITSIQDLITVFGGDYIDCNGKMSYPGGDGQLLGLKVGTTESDTQLLFSSGSSIDDTFALSNYGGIEIIDNVFVPK